MIYRWEIPIAPIKTHDDGWGYCPSIILKEIDAIELIRVLGLVHFKIGEGTKQLGYNEYWKVI